MDNACTRQYMVNGAGIREKGKEEHGKGGGHDQVRHIYNSLEELLPLNVQAIAREPNGQQQRHEYLRNEVKNPEQKRIIGVYMNVALSKNLDVIVETHKGGPNLHQPNAVVLKKTVIERGKKRY
jgi:hypothetical protein